MLVGQGGYAADDDDDGLNSEDDEDPEDSEADSPREATSSRAAAESRADPYGLLGGSNAASQVHRCSKRKQKATTRARASLGPTS